jgi:hypothetical protein
LQSEGKEMKSASKSFHRKIDEDAAFAHMKALVGDCPTNEKAAADLWLDTEAVVDAYIHAVKSRSGNGPSKQELGEACFWLLFQSQSRQKDEHYRLVVELLSPQFGLEMVGLLPRVQKLRESACAALEALTKRQSMDDATSREPSEDDIF